ncbi:MAG: DUF1501 domain-containing protein [Scytonema sp. CRU_2_7]|nr:DUF1501 domain-containing protein [Scytonema sp. CRU_2_7]
MHEHHFRARKRLTLPGPLSRWLTSLPAQRAPTTPTHADICCHLDELAAWFDGVAHEHTEDLISGGSVFGASDRIASLPTADPVTPADLTQTILHLVGVPASFEIHDQQGRAFRAVAAP